MNFDIISNLYTNKAHADSKLNFLGMLFYFI